MELRRSRGEGECRGLDDGGAEGGRLLVSLAG